MGKKRDLIIGAAFLAFSVAVFIASFGIRRLVVVRIGSAFVPQLAAILLGALSILLIVQTLLSLRTVSEAEVPAKKEEQDRAEIKRRNFSVSATLVLILVYLVLLQPVGFLLTTAVYLFAQFIVLSRKKPNYPLYAVLAIGTSVIIYYLFVKVFILFLPAGILG
jgi:putative tricarboxylic transport membrane protein